MRLGYWLRVLATVLAMTLLAGIVMFAVSLLVNEYTVQPGVAMLPVYLIYMSCLMEIVYLLSVWRVQLPVAIGFGCRRSEALAGLQLLKFGLCLVPLAIAALLAAIFAPDLLQTGLHFWAALLGVPLALGSLGNLFGAVYQFFGRRGVLVSALSLGACALFGGIFGGLSAMGVFTLPGAAATIVNAVCGGVGLVLCLADALVTRRLLGRYAVHF